MQLELVALVVEEYDPAIEFFVAVLGFELVEDSPARTNDGRPKRWVVVRPPGAATGLLLARADGPEQRGAVGAQFAGRVGLFLRVEDFGAAYARMAAAGVEFVTAPRAEPYGQVAVFLDVAGNRWDLLGPAAGGESATTSGPADVVVRAADASDSGAIAALRALWSAGADGAPDFERRMDAWLAAEGDRRTTWLAILGDAPVGMASLFEYRRMPRPGRPESRWGYVSNMFVREELRGRGIGSALLAAIIEAADERAYARLVLSPSPRSVPFYRRAGFVVPDDAAGGDRLLVLPR